LCRFRLTFGFRTDPLLLSNSAPSFSPAAQFSTPNCKPFLGLAPPAQAVVEGSRKEL
ncbi:hypothetical protein ACLOJK_023043, partial [Asimina triloba]